MEDATENARQTLSITEKTFTQGYQEMLTHIVRFTTSSTFYEIVNNSQKNLSETFANNLAQIQEPINVLRSSVSWIDSIIVAGPNKELYSLFENRIIAQQLGAFFSMNNETINGITWLTVRTSPLKKNNTIIPVIIPLRNLLSSQYIVVADTIEQSTAVILLFLDREKVEKSLSHAISAYSKNACFLLNNKGDCLSLTENSPYYLLAKGLLASPLDITLESNEKESYIIYSTILPFSDLRLAYAVSKKSLVVRINTMKLFVVLIILAGFIITTVLSFALSGFVTRPFGQLTAAVEKISNSTYNTPYIPTYNDETGKLATAINTMYATIQNQIKQIKQDERAKYRLELQLLAEQINPHFLYNTLESIHLEIANNHNKTAGTMIEDLGQVLRSSLNYGEDTIALSSEIDHVRSYIAIMNQRWGAIRFVATVENELEKYRILKNILQPLAENSIKHGFIKEKCEGLIHEPAIEIDVSHQNTRLVIEIADNGCGIDIEKAKKALYSEVPLKHVGLHNIYRRLCIFYGNVNIDIQSIPFFRNSIIITIPYVAEKKT